MKRSIYRALLGSFALFAAGCASARPSAVPAQAQAEGATAGATAEAPAYERILGSFSIQPRLFVYLDPATCERHFSSAEYAGAELRAIAEHMRALGSRRGEAAAELNEGAVSWFNGDGEQAYRAMVDAQHLFAEIGDVQGLAHTYEWLGWFFRESHEVEKAGEHLSVAYQLYGSLGDQTARDRVLAYGE